ncbi:L-ribulose-5-phosphate 4-epimerase [Pseudoalteromonas haloplanktis]|uniref:L-ribulose-5-phosphate 4-epimerase n=2 Tax=Pseudoalteromonas TaxID=53246 RepID=A0ABU1BB07_PSEHA|nr:L-ribulose-5-phosphate 4-epimerase [Pseudoalteromonas haloplanktis]MDQ9091618.1 L-ribulose-5-phosphate 4-epimerase [Pseudoalteromonas haloplanktis]
MSYTELKREVFEANMELQRRGLVIYTFGNVSQIDHDKGVIAIKPSGVSYDQMKAEDMVIVDLENNIVEGSMRPSSDTKTHIHLYRHFNDIGGVTHTHSTYATAWAQAKQSIPCFGTTHADYVHGDITCTRELTDAQVNGDYELETGIQITDAYKDRDPKAAPMVIVAGHAPFTWGKDAAQSVYHAALLEEIARMAYLTRTLDHNAGALKKSVMDKHYLRKHGKDAYYGQSNRG